ncbi:M1 family metallopeptidase [Pseudarthrobacter sp. P1]|uniref:M1 family metallopeptidase n=1 Tax=Pseudarthrobacter sp. P1 TaxID=3418418 RepID=UPI003CF81D22
MAIAFPDPYTPGSGSAGYTVTHYDLALDCRLASNRLSGRALISARTTTALPTLALDLAGLRATKVSVNGAKAAKFAQRGSKLHITPAAALAADADVILDIRYEGNPTPIASVWGELGWEELEDGVLVAGQPTGAPSWFPCNDHPADKASYRISISTDAGYRAVCNGALVSHTSKSSRDTWVYEQSEPMASYLATVQIGRYVLAELPGGAGVHSGAGGHPAVPIHMAVPRQLLGAATAALAHQRAMMETFAECFGPYPFGSYTVVVTADELEIPLESQSISVFGRNHLKRTWGCQRLIAHELSHQWFGNSLTAGSWRDIWLHEGFACYAEWLWSEESGAGTAAARARSAHTLLAGLPADLAIGDPGAEHMFDDRVYKRGALALHALRTAVGDALFFALLRRWTSERRHGTVDTAAFTALANQVCGDMLGFDATALLEPWLHRTELPAFPSPAAALV